MTAAILDLERVESVGEPKALPDGGRTYAVRGRFFGTWSAPASVQRSQTEDRALGSSSPSSGNIIRGIASSTGVDHHDTEMSRAALESMAAQFRAGVAYVPTHGEREWRDVIGRTVGAQVERVAQVSNAADPDEVPYVLWVETRLKPSHAVAVELMQAIDDEEPIGQSIGGWFTRITIVEDSRGDITRIIVEEVELDHLAVTRTPSNHDSMGLTRDRMQDHMSAYRALEGVEATESTLCSPAEGQALLGATESETERHVVEAYEDEDTVTVVFAKASMEESPSDEDDEQRDSAHDADDTTEGVVLEVANRSEANAEDTLEDPPMDMDALKEMLRSTVSEVVEGKMAGLEQRLNAVETGRSAPAPEATVTAIVTPDPEVEALRTKVATLETAKAELEAERNRESALLDRMLSKDVRRTKAYQTGAFHAVVEAREDGDFGALITRAKSEGVAPHLVRVSQSNKALIRLRDSEDGDGIYKQPSELRRDLKASLIALCRAAEADGMLDHLNPAKRSRWA